MDLRALLDGLYNEPDLDKRRYIPDKLAKLGDWESTPALGKLILDRDQPLIMRNEAVESLGKQGDPRAVSYLIQVLDDDDSDLRRTAVWSLGQIGTPETLEPIFSKQHDPSQPVRRWVAKAAGRVRNREVIGKLLQYYKNMDPSEDEKIVADIVRALTDQIDYAGAHDLSVLEQISHELLTTPVKSYVKQAAMQLLNALYQHGRSPDIDMLHTVLRTVPEHDPLLRPAVLTGLGYAGDIATLRNLKDTQALTARGIAGDIEGLEKQLKHGDLSTEEIIAVLNGFSHQGHIPQDPHIYTTSDNLSIRLQAMHLLAMNNRGKELIDQQFQSGEGQNAILEMYRYFGARALTLYEQTAFDKDKVLRQTTVDALISTNMMKHEDLHTQIRTILEKVNASDTIWHIRRNAREGIAAIDGDI